MILNKTELEGLIRKESLITGYLELESQLTCNGFDLTVKKVSEFNSCGALDFSNKERVLPETPELFAVKEEKESKFGWWELKTGAYKIETNEFINLPNNIIGMAFPRSSLLRMGAFTQTGVWDAGFKGKSEFILIVHNPCGLRLKQNARLIQLIFAKIKTVTKGYRGIYQMEPFYAKTGSSLKKAVY